ncbi:MAG: YopX family protein [Clostridia bacterium]
MNREHLFRGKRVDNGEEVVGSLVVLKDKCFIFIETKPSKVKKLSFVTHKLIVECVEVFPETVGQFTGLNDKNGKKIFEGDILRYNAVIRRVSWNIGECGFCVIDKQGFGSSIWSFNKFARTAKVEVEVIGNIHDNPELLEVEYVQ